MSALLPVLFECAPLAAKLTRASCARRHVEAKRAPTHRDRGKVYSAACTECPVGAAHARGETPRTWPDGALIRVGAVGAPQPPSSKPLAPPAPPRRSRFELPPAIKRPAPAPVTARTEESPMTNPVRKMVTHAGKTQSLDDWAKEVGVNKEALRMRIAKGWPLERAFSRDPGPRQVKGAPAIKPPIAPPRPAPPAITAPVVTKKRIDSKTIEVAYSPSAAPLPPADALVAMGYGVVSSIRTPAGFCIVVEAP